MCTYVPIYLPPKVSGVQISSEITNFISGMIPHLNFNFFSYLSSFASILFYPGKCEAMWLAAEQLLSHSAQACCGAQRSSQVSNFKAQKKRDIIGQGQLLMVHFFGGGFLPPIITLSILLWEPLRRFTHGRWHLTL